MDNNSSNLPNNSCVSTFSEAQIKSILITYGSVGGLATLICFTGLCLAISLKLWRQFVYRLAICQVTAALFIGISRTMQLPLMLADEEDALYNRLCKAIAFSVVTGDWIKLLFTLWIAVYLFVYSVFLTKTLKKCEYAVIPVFTITGLLVASVPLITDTYGKAGAWCWIKNKRDTCPHEVLLEGEIEQFALWFGPALFMLLLNSLLVVITMIVMAYRLCCPKKQAGESVTSDTTPLLETNRKALLLLLPLLAYPLIYCILIIIPLINRFYQIISHESSFGMFFTCAVLIPGVSFSAGTAFLIHIAVLERKKLCHGFGICKKRQNRNGLAINSTGTVERDAEQQSDDDPLKVTRASSTHTVTVDESEIEKQLFP
ncbi:PREDICTED: uncharacterized protein LOC109583771 [Amphimedon queenslandica]|uniref:G-protein coupled receptors family 2 profile 2 domain-containing protein n=1 Tax=Amphimedon queenslandica TaxID=400682 RepID=A0A1X7UF91_AMPQE|nr:PREDICTED: uncharacterized protein LOC109583771 [Amphimedon queenslandica]|eukprot:XP_019854785.1 PREDICTED: uncharacterized protein LOC109583771 [Amphimedon queenslandica]